MFNLHCLSGQSTAVHVWIVGRDTIILAQKRAALHHFVEFKTVQRLTVILRFFGLFLMVILTLICLFLFLI